MKRYSLRFLVVCFLLLPLSAASADDAYLRHLAATIERQNARISQLEMELGAAGTRSAQHASAQDGVVYSVFDENGNDIEGRFDSIVSDIEGIQGNLEDLGTAIDDVAGDTTIVHSGASTSTMKVIGRIHIDAWGISNTSGAIPAIEGVDSGGNPSGILDPQNRLGFRRVRFGVGGDIRDNMLYRIEMEFAGGNESEFRDVYLGWKELPVLQTLLLGNQKRPYGLDHLNSSRYNVFLERPFIIEAFNQDARRWGLVSYGVSADERFNWRYGVYNQRLIQDEGNYIGDHLQLELAGRLANTFWYDETSGGRGYAHWAISGTVADPNGDDETTSEARVRQRPEARTRRRWIDTGVIADADVYYLLGLESVANVGPIQFVGEYQQVWLNRDPGAGDDLDFWGGYFYISYFLTGEHMPWNLRRGTLGRIKPFENFWCVRRCDDCVDAGWGAWQLAVRYSKADLTDDNIFGGIGESFTFGLNWYWNERARMQFNYITGRIDDRFATLDSGDYSIFGARFMVDF